MVCKVYDSIRIRICLIMNGKCIVSVITDEQMAAAMLDRLANHGHLLMAGGRSYRMEHALMRQDAVVEPAS